jgi:hypothetical protein
MFEDCEHHRHHNHRHCHTHTHNRAVEYASHAITLDGGHGKSLARRGEAQVLPAVCCLLPAACCLLPAACCLLSAVERLPCAIYCLLSAVYCLESAVSCPLSAACVVRDHSEWEQQEMFEGKSHSRDSTNTGQRAKNTNKTDPL